MVGAAAGDDWGDSQGPDLFAVLVVVVAAVGVERHRSLSGPPSPAVYGRDGMEQGDELGDVVAVSASERYRQRDAVPLWRSDGCRPRRPRSRRPARAEGHEIRDEDVARLSPLKHKNLNLLGRYSFTASTPAAGALRPLHDPEAPELDEDDDGGGQE